MLGKRTLVLAALAFLALLAVPMGSAQAGVGITIGIGRPFHHYPHCYRPAVVIALRPVVVARPAVVVDPVYYAPSTVYASPAVVYVQPRPVYGACRVR